MLNGVLSIEDLAESFHEAKQAEIAAIDHRRMIGRQLETLIAGPAEGTSTHTGSHWKVTVQRKFTRGVDTDALKAKWAELGEAQNAFKWCADLRVAAYKALDDDLKSLADAYIICKPAMTTVDVKAIEDK